MKLTIYRKHVPEVAEGTQDLRVHRPTSMPKNARPMGQWRGYAADGSYAVGDTKEELADKLGGAFTKDNDPPPPEAA